MSALEPGARWPERVLFHECWGWDRLAATRTSTWLTIRDLKCSTPQLFDRSIDPIELHALDPTSRPQASAVLAALEEFARRKLGAALEPILDPALLRRLRELGNAGEDLLASS